MAVYVALLRGINVGKSGRITMADLRRVLDDAELTRVETYIQSGNVIFESSKDEAALTKEIGDALRAGFGILPAVVLRSAEELSTLVSGCPFTDDELSKAQAANTEGESFYVAFLRESVSPAALERFAGAGEQFRTVGRDVCILLRGSIRNAKLPNCLQKLDAAATVRNWNTVLKLQSLAAARTHN